MTYGARPGLEKFEPAGFWAAAPYPAFWGLFQENSPKAAETGFSAPEKKDGESLPQSA